MLSMPSLMMVRGSAMPSPYHNSRNCSQFERTMRFESRSRYCIIRESSIIPSSIHHEHASVSSTCRGPFRSGERAMRTRRTLTPGQKGTKKLLRQYGSQLVCVRYRYDAERRLRFKTVELIIEQAPWSPPATRIAGATLVGVRVGAKEVELQRQVKQDGGRWYPADRVWEMPHSQAMALGLKDRIEKLRVSNSRNPKMSNSGN